MIVGIREAAPVAPVLRAALMATVLLSVGACAELPLSSSEPAAEVAAPVDAAPVRTRMDAAPQERMPPMPREKPALLLKVSEGETVYSISRRFNVPPRLVIALNDLPPPFLLTVGQKLLLPRRDASDGRRYEPPVEAARRVWDQPPARTTEIAAPSHEVQVTVVETAAPARERTEAPAPPVPSAARVVRAEPARSRPSPPSSLSALARQADAIDVPLPPTRNTFLWPIEGRVISSFGSKPDGKHNDGINIAVPVGSDIRASQNGVVAYAGNELRGYGNLVLIRHDGGWMTAYAHNETLLVGKGDMVRRGQVISRSGKSGRVSRPQAHFEIRRDGEPQDPLRLLTRK